ncbi:outer membrane beta-barrel protein [Colwellia demingiae]|uniref:Outer membrane beta-barrel protein n=1 Tax=Colwellia demingiae TaxID=89401 RepID=A0A5C6QPW0_9GAMM|nr:OmpW family outer membrane protein [Colwellia demingiae]TWX71105.1 outer membrane beta-barrel protein [Colwellia demingiae]
MKKTLLTIALLSSLSTAAFANQAGDILIRGGATMVSPSSNEATVLLDGSATPLSISVDDNTQFGLNLVYFFDSNWAIELLAATPFTHDVILHDPQGVTNSIYGIDLNAATLAEVSHLPPTLSALYYFDTGTAFKPYVGVGVNYTIFFDEDFTSTPQAAGFSNLELDGSWGYSVQLGLDYELDKNWSVNVSARYIDINTKATFDIDNALNVPGGLVGKGSASVDVDPMVYSVMLGYTF